MFSAIFELNFQSIFQSTIASDLGVIFGGIFDVNFQSKIARKGGGKLSFILKEKGNKSCRGAYQYIHLIYY
jgi:hypothetical protein